MNLKSVVIGLAVLGLLAGVSSCKPARNEKGTSAEPCISDLKIDFVQSNTESAVPDFGHATHPNLLEGATREGPVLQLKKRISIPRGAPTDGRLFLAISEDAGPRRISEATFEHKSLSLDNVMHSDGHRMLLSYDRDYHQYFIPMNEMTGEKGESLGSLDLQILNLYLNWNDGSESHFEIHFSVTGNMPAAEQIRVSQIFSPPNFITTQNAGNFTIRGVIPSEGWTILKERYVNPTARPLLLQFSSAGLSYQIEMEHGVRMNWGKYPVHLPTDNGFEPDLHQFSRAPLGGFSLVFKNAKGEKVKTLALSKDVVSTVKMEPGQTFDVEWRVIAPSGPRACGDGALITRLLIPCDEGGHTSFVRNSEWRPSCNGWGATMTASDPIAIFRNNPKVDGNWIIRAFRIFGVFNNSVKVAEDIETSASTQAQASSQDMPLSMELGSSHGDTPMGSDLYSCQGIF